jgi:hypothetical protein
MLKCRSEGFRGDVDELKMGEGRKEVSCGPSKLPRVDSIEGMLWNVTALDSFDACGHT